ncbi:N-acetyltransferase 10 [Phytophthora cinnamomi]|uniref:N-acetyltransferase 10 n=1 Tax=Phytophthora cinnamomi TaxID=4785 RepID=UPI00355A56ED|nr:N-acetyltransferase 10 [Phytophthora cinnamomi]
MHAYIGLPPSKPDSSALRVKDGKQIEIANGSTGETLGLQLDHVYQQASEADVMERSIRPLVAACIEGVNVSVLAVGSAKTQKNRVLFSPMPEQSLAAAVFQTLFDTLQNKVAALSSSGASVPAANGGITSARKNQVISAATFSLRASFVELYEETAMDLLASTNVGSSDSRPALSIEDDPVLGKTIKNLTQSPPLASLGDFRRLLDAGLNTRRSTNGLYGNSSEFSSAVLRISAKQTFAFRDAATQELHSFFDLVDLPATDRLARAGSAVRLSEGPLLNKSLFALQDVVENLTHNSGDEVSVRYQGSQLTTLLQDALGGNCLTFVLMCLSPGDMTGSAATLQLGKMLPRVCTFPVVNNDMLRGLRRRQFMAQKQLPSAPATVAVKDGTMDAQKLVDYERRLHDLEGKLAQNALERRMLREDKDALTVQLGELRAKYRELFDNELSLRSELLACEQEKLALSKAFVAFQLERDTQLQQLDSDKFEVETRLLKAEQVVVEIQQDDATKAAQIQDLCAKMNELVADKTRLGGELALLQKAAKTAESARDAEAKKNQQLSLELIVAVNQKQKFQGEMEALATQLRSRQSQVDAQLTEYTQLRSDNEVLRQKVAGFEEKLEAMRKDVVRRELELERAELAVKKEQLETQQAGRDADTKRELSVRQLSDELETQRAAFAAGKRSLELQLERVQADLARESREKQYLMVSLRAKNEENEELLLALERARHDLQAQLETFRLKLALLQQSCTSGERTAEPGAGIQALRELITSYQVRERELRDELSGARNTSLRLARRLRDPAQESIEPLQNNSSEKDRNHEDGEGPHETGEIEQLRERLAAAEQQVASEMERRTDQALVLAELEAQNAQLVQEQKERERVEQAAPARDKNLRV